MHRQTARARYCIGLSQGRRSPASVFDEASIDLFHARIGGWRRHGDAPAISHGQARPRTDMPLERLVSMPPRPLMPAGRGTAIVPSMAFGPYPILPEHEVGLWRGWIVVGTWVGRCFRSGISMAIQTNFDRNATLRLSSQRSRFAPFRNVADPTVGYAYDTLSEQTETGDRLRMNRDRLR